MRQPGAYHHARFMGKSIYLLKIFLMSDVFQLTRREKPRISRLAQFIALLYGKYFLSSISSAAPLHDLNFWYDLKEYRRFDAQAADAALISVRRHLWYLSPELVIFSLFDDKVSAYEKKLMANAIVRIPRPQVFAPGKPSQPDFDPIAVNLTQHRPPLASFVSPRSWLFFHLVDGRTQWLNDEPSTWTQNPTYLRLYDMCNDIQVVNDVAERAVKDVQDFATMTRDPAHRDDIIIVANDHRCRITHTRKDNLNYM